MLGRCAAARQLDRVRLAMFPVEELCSGRERYVVASLASIIPDGVEFVLEDERSSSTMDRYIDSE